MILKRIEAENILRYRRLQLTDLPAFGQIAVAGANEAGKTTIGETICFGLFGRTFSLGPDEFDKLIRWGEYHAVVRLEFTVADNVDYVVVRDINNTGRHEARLYRSGQQSPLAEGPGQVAKVITELCGFTYKSFIDSFYLAQREIEVPHGKSETVKALIGVDRLEAVAAELEAESAELAAEIDRLENQAQDKERQITEFNLDRTHLGHLESQQAQKVDAAETCEAEHIELTGRAELIGKAADALAEAVEGASTVTCAASYIDWRRCKEWLATSLAAAGTASRYASNQPQEPAFARLSAVMEGVEQGLAGFDQVQNLATLYRQRLANLLDDNPTPEPRMGDEPECSGGSERRFCDRRAAVLGEIGRITRRSRPLLVLGAVFVLVSLLGWAGWVIPQIAPQSQWAAQIQHVSSFSESTGRSPLLRAAAGATLLTGLVFVLYGRTSRQLRACHGKLEAVDTEVQIARVEMGIIDRMEEAALPETLDALRGVGNDFLHSAVASLASGPCAALVRPELLADKLAEIREQGLRAAKFLRETQERIRHRAAGLHEQAADLRRQVARIEAETAKERRRWEQVEALQRAVETITSKVGELRDQIAVRELGRELIDGACRRIYARFHPELRRVVSKILPLLTNDRYEHLELDDELHVRVFCKEKNDFVGLAELSNGAHRQLMLCIRLALAQALIASTGRGAQFIFFDEPFAFFDEQRMARAIEVLRRISPQITQIWLAAQRFDAPSAFEMVLDCAVDTECLCASGADTGHAHPADEPIRPFVLASTA